jgi:hypothetical protein
MLASMVWRASRRLPWSPHVQYLFAAGSETAHWSLDPDIGCYLKTPGGNEESLGVSGVSS